MAAPSSSTLRLSRRFVALGGMATLVSGCVRFGGPAHVEEVADVAYVPVDPKRAETLLNAYRAENGIAPLALDGDLLRLAGEYARHLAEAGRMTHDLEPYGGLEKRLKASGYAYATAGENLGQGYRTLEQVIAGWKKSPPHDRGMKDADMTRMGIASFANPAKRGDIYWCLIVARPRSEGAPRGGQSTGGSSKPFTWGSVSIPFVGGR